MSESELARLHQEVLKEQGIPLEESIDYETRLFGTKNKLINNINKSKNTTINNNKSLNKNASFNKNINKNKSLNVEKKKFAYDIESSTDSMNLQTRPKFQSHKNMKYQSSDEKLHSNLSSGTPKNNNYNANLMTQLGVKSLPVKVNLEQVNLNDDSFLKDNDLTLVEFSSSYNTDDESEQKKTKFAKNLDDFRKTYEANKGIDADVDINLKNKMDKKENDIKRKTNEQVISKNLN